MNRLSYNSMHLRSDKRGFTSYRGSTPCGQIHSLRSESASHGPVKPQRGFTLIETLVAITVLLVAIGGPMTIAARGLQTAFFAREQITAQYLAQEGAEYVRWVRDTNELQGRGWLTGLSACGSARGCRFDMRNTANVPACSASGAQNRLRLDGGTFGTARGMYYHGNGGTETFFERCMQITETVANREALVTVTVSWPSGLFGQTRSVVVQSSVFNQYDNN